MKEVEFLLDNTAEDNSEMEAAVNSAAWIKCPFCRISFKISSGEHWNGEKHLSCGQKIKIVVSAGSFYDVGY
jgi:nitrite reductase/ring-hydroxylating ferredoxin subunit